MMPIVSLDQLKIQWLKIEKNGYKLYGFLIYTGSDTALIKYLEEGIFELDILSGSDCAIFLIEPPSKRWIDYTKKKGHTWFEIFHEKEQGDHAQEDDPDIFSEAILDSDLKEAKTLIAQNRDCVIAVGANINVTLDQLINPKYGYLYNRAEAIYVARHFNFNASDIPVLVFFKQLDEHVIHHQSLTDLDDQTKLTKFFRSFFDSSDFLTLIQS